MTEVDFAGYVQHRFARRRTSFGGYCDGLRSRIDCSCQATGRVLPLGRCVQHPFTQIGSLGDVDGACGLTGRVCGLDACDHAVTDLQIRSLRIGRLLHIGFTGSDPQERGAVIELDGGIVTLIGFHSYDLTGRIDLVDRADDACVGGRFAGCGSILGEKASRGSKYHQANRSNNSSHDI